jgi:hypothetical protein
MTPPSSSTGTLTRREHRFADQDLREFLPAGFGVDVADRRREPLAERHRTRALGQPLLLILEGLGGLVRGAGPAQLPLDIDQHEPDRVGPEQLFGRVGQLLQGPGQAPFWVQAA